MDSVSNIPTCADCEMIGFAICKWMTDAERELGPQVMREFLRANAGVNYFVPRHYSPERALADPVGFWINQNIGYSDFRIPMGPCSKAARNAWQIYQLLSQNHTNRSVAKRVRCGERMIEKHKRKLRLLGLLDAPHAVRKGNDNAN